VELLVVKHFHEQQAEQNQLQQQEKEKQQEAQEQLRRQTDQVCYYSLARVPSWWCGRD
jgi:hypothetical protein